MDEVSPASTVAEDVAGKPSVATLHGDDGSAVAQPTAEGVPSTAVSPPTAPDDAPPAVVDTAAPPSLPPQHPATGAGAGGAGAGAGISTDAAGDGEALVHHTRKPRGSDASEALEAVGEVVTAVTAQREQLLASLQQLGSQLWGTASANPNVTAIAQKSELVINEENRARYEKMAEQCRLLVGDVAASQEAADTASVGQQLLLVAQQAISEHLLDVVQGLLREPESKEVVAEGTEVATKVLPQELAQEALRMLQVVMAAKHPDDVIIEMHTWSKWADADTLQRLFTQGGGMEMLTADGVKSLLESPALSKYVNSGKLAEWIASGQLTEWVGQSQIMEWLRSGQLAEWVGSGQMAEWLSSGKLAEMVGNGQLVSMLKDGQLKEWVDAEALAQWVNPDKLRELGVDVEDLDELATYLTETAAEELPGALEKGAEFLQAARENKQAQALLTKAKELMSSGNASQDINKLLSWSKEASKEELVETVKNRVLDFLLDQLPEIEVPPIEGVKDKMYYHLDNLDLGGLRLNKEDVLVELNAPPSQDDSGDEAKLDADAPATTTTVVVAGASVAGGVVVTGVVATYDATDGATDSAASPAVPASAAEQAPAKPTPPRSESGAGSGGGAAPKGSPASIRAAIRRASVAPVAASGAGGSSGAGAQVPRSPHARDDDARSVTAVDGRDLGEAVEVFTVTVRNIRATMKDIKWRYKQKKFPYLGGDGQADASVAGGVLKLGFMVERAPAIGEAYEEWLANPDRPMPAEAVLQPQLSLSTVEVSVGQVELSFKGTWLSAVYNMLANVFSDTVREYLASSLKEAIQDRTRELLMPVNKAATSIGAWRLILNLANTQLNWLSVAPKERWFDIGLPPQRKRSRRSTASNRAVEVAATLAVEDITNSNEAAAAADAPKDAPKGDHTDGSVVA